MTRADNSKHTIQSGFGFYFRSDGQYLKFIIIKSSQSSYNQVKPHHFKIVFFSLIFASYIFYPFLISSRSEPLIFFTYSIEAQNKKTITKSRRQNYQNKYNYIKQAQQMRSLIKMEVSKYPVFDVVPINQLPFKQQQARCNGAATHHSMRNSLKRNAIYSHNSNRVEQMPQQLEEIDEKKGQKKSRNSMRIDSIQKYIGDLTNDIENPRNEPDFGETKFKVLKRIIQHYDIKTMEKNQYSKLIKTFGLQIQPVKTERKEIKSHNQNRSFKIKSTMRGQSRLSSLKNRVENNNQGQVALLQFSKQLKPASRQTSYRDDKKIGSETLSERYKIRINISKQKSLKENSPGKKISPFKFKSVQDILVEKINKYRQFLFVLNYSNNMYRKMDLQNYDTPLKFYVGPGNNSNLVKSLLKKRFYFEQTSKISQANFIWTQIKIDQIFANQSSFQANPLQPKKKMQKKELRNKFATHSQYEQNLERILTKTQANCIIKVTEDLNRKVNTVGFEDRLKYMDKKLRIVQIQRTQKIHNHLPSNGLLGNKKGLFYCLRQYYKITGRNVWDILPLTFHISKGILDNDFKQFNNYYNERKKNKLPNVWIMKPGEFSNRGNGITCSNKFQEIKKRASKCHVNKNGEAKTLILQLYISNPILYNNRKFDIRVYMLVTCHNGKFKGYWYQQGYIRTSSYIFNLNQLADSDIHLTNDAIQKNSQNYGKYEPGNKLSYAQLQRYLDSLNPNGRNLDFYGHALPRMKQIAAESLMSSFMFLDEHKKENNFQIFGLDFMLDYNLRPWLIQINTNPCLQLSSPLLQRIIPHMVENAFRIGLDTLFPPPDYVPHNYKYIIAENALHYNKFQLIFDEERDGAQVREIYDSYPGSSALVSSLMGIKQDQEVYEEEGVLCDYDI